ncbi:TonB-dependent receptor plug domain-containing protein [Marinobacter sp. C2H3]|uniref:TonB-dependent receptor plug domain-containing protein n=1 Tax=Marinobacter sp. C2H3 TaxID=3119003 RepID=UPI00300EC869
MTPPTPSSQVSAIAVNRRSGSFLIVAALCTVPVLWLPATAARAADDSQDNYYGFSDDVPEVLTTTRLRQSKVRTPGTTTVIDGDTIRKLGINNLPDIFQLVPGMVVTSVGNSNPVVTYHGTSHYEQRRMQVLVDGRTAYRTALADMDWQSMPVPLEMIERVEVARGPNAAAYGINAFLGTINFITRDPADTAGTEVHAMSGSRGYLRTFAAVGDASGDYDWRLDFEKRKFDGYDFAYKRNPVTGVKEKNPYRNGLNMNVFNYDSRWSPSSDYNLELRGGVVDGLNEEDKREDGDLNPITSPDIDVRDYYLQTRLNFTPSDDHFYHLQAYYQRFNRRQRWKTEQPSGVVDCVKAGLDLLSNYGSCFVPNAAGDPPFRANVNADLFDSRLEFELQDTRLFSEQLKLVSGLGYREDRYTSETYFNGDGADYQSRVFGNVEYTPIHWLTLNAGGNYEHTTTTDEGYFSPRVAANLVFSNNHALRFVYSEAVRTPDAFEQFPDYGYTLHDVSPGYAAVMEGFRARSADFQMEPSLTTIGQPLDAERIVSREISYFGQFPLDDALLQLEVRAFQDKMRDMISGVIAFDTWTIDNSVALDQEGFEVEAELQYPGTTLRATYGYLDQDGWYTGKQQVDADEASYRVTLLSRLSAQHTGSVMAIQDLPHSFTFSSAMYWADRINGTLSQRIDFRLAKNFYIPQYTAEVAFTMQHYVNDEPVLRDDNNIEDPNQFFVEAGVRF